MNYNYKPNDGSYPVFYKGYMDSVPDEPFLELLKKEKEHTLSLLNSISDEKSNYRYAPGKWSIKQVIMHIIDTEMVFSYRGLAIARGEKQSLPGFNQDEYMSNIDVERISLNDLIQAFSYIRSLNILLFGFLQDGDLDKEGIASGYPVTARAIAYFIAGHAKYHVEILKDRYQI